MLAWATRHLQAAQGRRPPGCLPCSSAQNASLGDQGPEGGKHQRNTSHWRCHAWTCSPPQWAEMHLKAAQLSVPVFSEDVSLVPGPSIVACSEMREVMYEYLRVCKRALLGQATRVARTDVRPCTRRLERAGHVQRHTGCMSNTNKLLDCKAVLQERGQQHFRLLLSGAAGRLWVQPEVGACIHELDPLHWCCRLDTGAIQKAVLPVDQTLLTYQCSNWVIPARGNASKNTHLASAYGQPAASGKCLM